MPKRPTIQNGGSNTLCCLLLWLQRILQYITLFKAVMAIVLLGYVPTNVSFLHLSYRERAQVLKHHKAELDVTCNLPLVYVLKSVQFTKGG